MKPALITFDVFGTIIDWRSGLLADLEKAGVPCSDALFDQIIAAQAKAEQRQFRTYREITSASLVEAVGLDPSVADAIGAQVGRWPLYPDAREALRLLQRTVPCMALTNSDKTHREQVQEQLGFSLSDWLCAEEVRVYKPNAAFWRAAAAHRQIQLGKDWWHASAYADYDLRTAASLGLTTVFVERPHSLAGTADHRVRDLDELVARVMQALSD
jgi:2-haloalkanoic acid dehalogenase type II